MDILICSFTYPPELNGVSHAVKTHYEALILMGHNVKIATGFCSTRKELDYIVQFKINGTGRLGNRFRGDIVSYKNYLCRESFDAIFFHCWEIWSTEIAIDVFEHIKAKKVIFSHGTSFELFKFTFRGVLRWALFRTYQSNFIKRLKKFDYYVFLTNSTKRSRFSDKFLVEKLGLTNYMIIPNCANKEFALKIEPNSFKKKYNIHTQNMILCLANYQPIKNQMKILKICNDEIYAGISFVFIGSNCNSYYKRLVNYKIKNQLNNVHLLYDIDKADIIAAYQTSDIFLLFSETEAQPIVLLDAMAAGLPFIANDVGCIDEFKGGVVVKNIKEAKLLIYSLLFDEQKLVKLKLNGKQNYTNNYSEIVLKKNLKTLIHNISKI